MVIKVKRLLIETFNPHITKPIIRLADINNTKRPNFTTPIQKLSRPNIIVNANYFQNNGRLISQFFHNNQNDYSIFFDDMQKLLELSRKYNNDTPVTIMFENLNPSEKNNQFLFKNQTKIHIYDGLEKPYGKSNLLGVEISKIEVRLDITSPYAMAHEFGHVLDNFNAEDKNWQESESKTDEFNRLVSIIINETSNRYSDTMSDYNLIYLFSHQEIYARCFNIWYDKEVFQHKPNVNNPTLFNITDKTRGKSIEFVQQYHPIEYTLYQIYDQYPELEQYFTKRFGEIIPPENAKLYNQINSKSQIKTKKSNMQTKVITDQELLTKLSIAENNNISKTSYDLDMEKD